MTEEGLAHQRGWLHAPIARVDLSRDPIGYAHLVIPGAWNVDIPLDVAAQLDAKPGTMVSFEVADRSKAGGENTLYQVAIGEVVVWIPGEEGEASKYDR